MFVVHSQISFTDFQCEYICFINYFLLQTYFGYHNLSRTAMCFAPLVLVNVPPMNRDRQCMILLFPVFRASGRTIVL